MDFYLSGIGRLPDRDRSGIGSSVRQKAEDAAPIAELRVAVPAATWLELTLLTSANRPRVVAPARL